MIVQLMTAWLMMVVSQRNPTMPAHLTAVLVSGLISYIRNYTYGIFSATSRDGTIQDTKVSMHHAKTITIPQYITAF